MSIRNWFEEKAATLRVGAPVKIANDGKAIDEVVIRYKDFYFSIWVDAETGEPTGDFGWSRDFGMFPATPVREHLKAERERSKVSDQANSEPKRKLAQEGKQ